MICNCKDICKQAIVNWCKTHRNHLDDQFCDPLTDSEFQNALDVNNWIFESDEPENYTDSCGNSDVDDWDDCYEAWSLNCEPFDDQLRAYVKVNDGQVTEVCVVGE